MDRDCLHWHWAGGRCGAEAREPMPRDGLLRCALAALTQGAERLHHQPATAHQVRVTPNDWDACEPMLGTGTAPA
eukprot:11923884-Heterocapsa_arctica.AAC.1